MKRFCLVSILALLAVSCADSTNPLEVGPDGHLLGSDELVAQRGKDAARPLKMSNPDFEPVWAIPRDQELACGGDEIAGGEIEGTANFTHLGRTTLSMTAAWDIGNLLPSAEFTPVGPAGGPVAPVLGPDDYPYAFHVNPFTGTCESVVSATGELTLTAANGDMVFGRAVGGETHRLDFVVPGDGTETFAIIEITGGTGRFEGASGEFITHTIVRFDFEAMHFVIDFVEMLPGATIVY